MRKTFLLFWMALSWPLAGTVCAQGPEVTSWILNLSNYTGYNNILADVQQVRYSTNYVYLNATGIPAYNIGPWPGNPNTPNNQNWTFKIPRFPVENTGPKTSTTLGQIAVLINGAAIFNALDAFSYNNQNIWHQDANVFEGQGFDNTGGHPAPQGTYHYHTRPVPLFPNSASQHSPIIGYAFDGFPIYGPFGYADPNDAGSTVKRMESSYQLRNITQRTSLPDGTQLQPNQYGPAVGGQYPLGAFVEDYVYAPSSGDLDQYNGRICVTPEYPGGIYAYFTTTDAGNDGVYPYFLALEYYGIVEMGNIGPGGGHVNVTEPTTTWNGQVSVRDPQPGPDFQIYPNPAGSQARLSWSNGPQVREVRLLNALGQVIDRQVPGPGAESMDIGLEQLPAGVYFVQCQSAGTSYSRRLVVR